MSRVAAAVTVSIPQGTLRGRKQKTHSGGRSFCSFQGIPYAKPPVGPLRFKPPEPPEKWNGIRNATVEGNMAPQFDIFTQSYKGEEDCLFLNIYTPKLPTGNSSDLIPVMVWIHGGGFCMDSANTHLYGPDHLMEHDIVLVSFNYRLSVLGFLSTDDEVIPGNFGLKDQVAALKWVKSNISLFGGDPTNVTIFGESAGSVSVHLLQLSSVTQGLFHRAICQSGVSGIIPSTPPARDRAFRLGKALGFSGSSSEELLAFLAEQPAQKLIEAVPETMTKEEKQRRDQFLFHPTIEKHKTPDSIITDDLRELLKSGKFNKVPIIIGVVSREGLLFISQLLQNKSSIRELNTNFQALLPGNMNFKREERLTVARDMKRFYFENQPLEEDTIDNYADLLGDLIFVHPSLVAARIHSSLTGSPPVYYYYFDAVTKLNILKKMFQAEGFSGACHGDDVPYIFSGHMSRDIPIGPDTVEGKAIARMTRLWTNFAKTGNPTPLSDDPLLSTTWTPFTKEEKWYLHISEDGLSVKKDLLKERMDFWDKLLKL